MPQSDVSPSLCVIFQAHILSSAYTGYIDVQARHLFFYFFESRNDPDQDDIIFWTNGGKSHLSTRDRLLKNVDTGPGYSSSMGLFMEHGPCSTLESVEPEYNPYSWTTNANVFYVDQPVGTGFSYADYGEYVVCSMFGWHECPAHNHFVEHD